MGWSLGYSARLTHQICKLNANHHRAGKNQAKATLLTGAVAGGATGGGVALLPEPQHVVQISRSFATPILRARC
jgi:hypothetical protein